jgi:hypothetical protein
MPILGAPVKTAMSVRLYECNNMRTAEQVIMKISIKFVKHRSNILISAKVRQK